MLELIEEANFNICCIILVQKCQDLQTAKQYYFLYSSFSGNEFNFDRNDMSTESFLRLN